MSSSVQSLIDYGVDGLIVDIECYLSNNLPNIVIVGYANKAVDEARERVRGAFSSSGIDMPRKRITINLAPADIPKASSSFDLAIAAAIMLATPPVSKPRRLDSPASLSPQPLTKQEAVIGELGLDGAVRPVRGIIGKLLAGRRHGITTFYIPTGNLAQASMVPGIRLVPVTKLSDLRNYLFKADLFKADEMSAVAAGADAEVENPHAPTASQPPPPLDAAITSVFPVNLSDIVGQQQAKRALEISAAGGHNLLLGGPPGTGKSMLARALPSILPRLTAEEKLEATHLHSLSGKDYDRIISEPPFRSPHHSASHVSIVGGGSVLRPGEISLAHRGILFFDELPEFKRSTIEALRQPLEDRSITLARANDRLEFPANFILIATANPCPCGFYGVTSNQPADRNCDCAPSAIQRYRAKLSGPIMDRIDLYSEVHDVDHSSLLSVVQNVQATADDEAVRQRVGAARRVQAERFGGPSLNAVMTNREIAGCAAITAEAKSLMDAAGRSLGLSARAYLRTVKVARTIADLDASAGVKPTHVSEALQYRSRLPQAGI